MATRSGRDWFLNEPEAAVTIGHQAKMSDLNAGATQGESWATAKSIPAISGFCQGTDDESLPTSGIKLSRPGDPVAEKLLRSTAEGKQMNSYS